MSDVGYDLTREAHRGYPIGVSVMAGGAIVDAPNPLDVFGPYVVSVTDHGTTIVPVSSKARLVTVENEGYCFVRLGGTNPGSGVSGFKLRPRQRWQGMVRGELTAIAPARSMGTLSVAVGV